MCELKSKTDRGSSSMSEIVAKRVGLFSSGEKKKQPNSLDQHQPPGIWTKATKDCCRLPKQLDLGWLAMSLSIMQPTDSSSTAEFGSMKGWSTTGHFFYNSASIDFPLCHRNEQLASSPPRHYEHSKGT